MNHENDNEHQLKSSNGKEDVTENTTESKIGKTA